MMKALKLGDTDKHPLNDLRLWIQTRRYRVEEKKGGLGG